MTADSDAYGVITAALARVTGYQPPNDRGDWRCPAHPDSKPSLSVNRGQDKVLIKCQRDCPTSNILDVLGLPRSALFDQPAHRNGNGNGKSVIQCSYPYVDEDGRLLFEVVRYYPKGFRQRRPDGNGGWIWKLGDVRRVLYRLPEVRAAIAAGRRIWVVEGEKDVEAVEAAGEVATCNPGGADKWRPEFTEQIEGAYEVIIVADKDENQAGYRHAIRVAHDLRDRVGSVTVVEAAHGKDAAEHLGAGRTIDEFVPVIHEFVPVIDEPKDQAPAEDQVELDILRIESIADVALRVDSADPIGWLAKPVWPADAYGVSAASKKAGKTWMALDLAVSVSSGTPWLGVYPCDSPGPVLLFLGEGGERKMVRRLRAVASARGLDAENLRLRLCFRAPRLTNAVHLDRIAEELQAFPAALVIVDPLYLAASGAKGSDLYGMGAVLEGIQHVCQRYGAALAVITHWNKSGQGSDSDRITGVGPGEWGRVLVSTSVEHRQTEPDRSTVATLKITFEGDEIPETELRLRRWIRADDPDDLDSPLQYRTEPLEGEARTTVEGLRPAEQRILDVLTAADDWLDVHQIGDDLAVDATGLRPLKARTIQAGCKTLVARRLVDCAEMQGGAYRWRAAASECAQETTREDENAF